MSSIHSAKDKKKKRYQYKNKEYLALFHLILKHQFFTLKFKKPLSLYYYKYICVCVHDFRDQYVCICVYFLSLTTVNTKKR